MQIKKIAAHSSDNNGGERNQIVKSMKKQKKTSYRRIWWDDPRQSWSPQLGHTALVLRLRACRTLKRSHHLWTAAQTNAAKTPTYSLRQLAGLIRQHLQRMWFSFCLTFHYHFHYFL